MSERLPTACKSQPSWSQIGCPVLLQRECACGGSAGLDDQCEDCRKEQFSGQLASLHPRLSIGPADDHYERQADRVADTVMRTPASGALGFSIEKITPLVRRQSAGLKEEEPETDLLQRQPAEEEEEEEIQASPIQRQTIKEREGKVLRKRAPGTRKPDRAALTGTDGRVGRPLPATERAFFEPRFGFDFSDVRIHTGGQAAASARAVGAKAYTVGRNMVFGEGQWAPGTQTGRRLIAHELTHVVQQRRARRCDLSLQREAAKPRRERVWGFWTTRRMCGCIGQVRDAIRWAGFAPKENAKS